jgi:hypothetical protein
LIIRAASSTDQAPLTSIRSRPDGPSAARTASTRSRSSVSVWPRSATLTFAVRQPETSTIAAASCGPTAGTVQFTGIDRQTASGQDEKAASRAAASHRADSMGPYSGNGENSPQPAGPSMSIPVRTACPRNLVRIGIE